MISVNVDDRGVAIATAWGVDGHLNGHDVTVLQSMTAQYKGEKYIEIGSYLGCSAVIIAKENPETLVYAHDIWETDMKDLPDDSLPPDHVADYFLNFYSSVTRLGLERQIIPVRGDSKYTMKIHADESAGCVFIDGDHSFQGCLADLREAWRVIRPGGVVMVHDCHVGSDVHRAIQEFGETEHHMAQAPASSIRILKKS
jgi:predicted O-methyltransferase YrrM